MNKNTFLKGFLPFASATLLLSSCSEDKTVPGDNDGQAIVFRVQNTLPSSRAAGTTVSQINAFVVNAQADAGVPDNERVVMDGVTVSRTESSANSYDYSPRRYFPAAAASVSFSAYSPVSKNIGAGFKGNTNNTITYTVPAPVPSGEASQEDLLVARTNVTKGSDGFGNAVVLQFRHALSRVYVKAANYLSEPVHITGLGLHNLYTQGTLDIDGDINESYQSVTSGDNTGKYKVLWQHSGTCDGRYDYVLAEADATVPARTANPIMLVSREQGMLVLPQTTKNKDNDQVADAKYGDGAGDFCLRVAYHVSNYDDELFIPFPDLNGLAEGLTFEMGRQYALTLSFAENEAGGPISVKFQLEVEEWDEPPIIVGLTVAFDANGGTDGAPEPSPVVAPANGGPILLPVPTGMMKSNFAFLGWSSVKDDNPATPDVNEARAAIVSSPYYATANTTLYAVWEDPNEVLEDAQISLGSTKIVIGNPDENTTDLQELQEAISELQALVQGTTEERTIETADGPVTETYTIYDALAIGDMSHRIEALTTSLSTTGNYLIVPELYFQYIPPANWGLEEKTVPVQTVMLLTPTSGSKTFEFELSGGAGGHMWARTNNTAVGGKGGYVKAQYAFTGVHTEYSFDIRVGGMGEGMAQYDGATGNYGMITAFPGGRTVESQHPGGGNGGGNGGAANTSTYRGGSGGGGATDIRPANDATSLSGCTTSDPRFLVAAGGGGAAQASGSPWNGLKGGDGGGDTGRIGQFGAGGSSYTMEASTQTSGFQPGIGEDGARGATLYEGRGGGGAGWWGGHAISSNTGTPTGGGAGGSSYVGTPTGGTIQGMSVNETLQANTWSDGWVLIKWVK